MRTAGRLTALISLLARPTGFSMPHRSQISTLDKPLHADFFGFQPASGNEGNDTGRGNSKLIGGLSSSEQRQHEQTISHPIYFLQDRIFLLTNYFEFNIVCVFAGDVLAETSWPGSAANTPGLAKPVMEVSQWIPYLFRSIHSNPPMHWRLTALFPLPQTLRNWMRGTQRLIGHLPTPKWMRCTSNTWPKRLPSGHWRKIKPSRLPTHSFGDFALPMVSTRLESRDSSGAVLDVPPRTTSPLRTCKFYWPVRMTVSYET